MTYVQVLEITANWAAILTAIIALSAPLIYFFLLWRKRRKLENYLSEDDKIAHSVIHLVARLGDDRG